LIKPSANGGKAQVHRVMLGGDVLNGEVTQLFVPGGWWKASEIPEEDLQFEDRERIGCLISEVVVPGWQPEQHIFLDQEKVSSG
jgi:predicted cupin superfamily sugar epimerase